MHSYTTDQLKKNRAVVMVYGGGEADRRAFAQQAAQSFADEGPMVEAKDEPTLLRALARPRGVVYMPDVTQLGVAAQREVVRAIREQEERPKLVFGLPVSPDAALDRGLIRDDLHYWFRRGLVDVKAKPSRR